jgi:chromosome segregation ATPase
VNFEQEKANLEALNRKKSQLEQDRSRIQGHLEQAQKELKSLEDECRAKGIDPEKLPELLEQAKQRYQKDLADFTLALETAEKSLKPYMDKLK